MIYFIIGEKGLKQEWLEIILWNVSMQLRFRFSTWITDTKNIAIKSSSNEIWLQEKLWANYGIQCQLSRVYCFIRHLEYGGGLCLSREDD